MKRTKKLWVWFLALAMIFSLLPATAFAEGDDPASGEVVTEEEASIEFIGVSGQSYTITAGLVGELAHTEVVRWKDATETAAYLKDVLEAVGAGEDLGDCSYTLTATDGYNASIVADWYDDFGLYLENGAPRFVLMDSTLIQGGWYSPAPLATIEAKNHSYDENGACVNPINTGKGQTEPCGAIEPSIEFIGVSGQSYKIRAGLVAELAHTEVVRWKDVTETAAYLKDVLEAVGAGEDLGDCSYTLTATDEYNASIPAEWYDDFGLFLENGAPRFVLMDSTLIQGGWYSPAPLTTIKAKNHSYNEDGTCENPINTGKGQTEPCGAESTIEFIGVSGESYLIPSSVVKTLATTEVERWKGVLVNAAYMKDVLEAVGAAGDLGDCSYELVASDGYSAALDADWYDNFGLFMDGGIPRFVLMDSTLVQGGWYSPAPLATITAKNHVHGEHGICDNQISTGKGQTTDCGENTHVAGEAKEETVPATYAEAEYIASVVRCTICDEVLESTFVRETGVKSLKDQAADAAAAYEEAKAEVAKYTGEAAVAPAAAAAEAADAAKAAAEAAYESAKELGLDEATLAEAAEAVTAAEQLVSEAAAIEEAVKTEADAAADVRDAAVAALAQLDNQVDPSAYTASSYAVYEEAYNAFKELAMDDSATADQLRSARSAVTKAFIRLVPKEEQTLTTTTKGGSKDYAALAKENAVFTLVTVKGNEGALTFTKSSGSSKATVDKATGEVTMAKGTPAGSYAIKIKITAAATDDYLEATKTVTVKVTVTKAANPIKVKTAAKTTTVAKAKKAKVTISGAITVTKAQGTVTYTKAGGSKYLTVNKSSGKITVAKGTPAGKYKIKVKIKAAGNKNYKAKTVTKTITVTVKK